MNRRMATVGVAYAFLVTMIGTTMPTPLYPIYEERFGFAALTVTVVYAVYGLGVLATLLLVGPLSDRFGRRPLLLPGLGFAAASSVVFLLAQGLPALFVGRVLSGISAGLFTGHGDRRAARPGPAVGQAARDADRHRGQHGRPRPRAADGRKPGGARARPARACPTRVHLALLIPAAVAVCVDAGAAPRTAAAAAGRAPPSSTCTSPPSFAGRSSGPPPPRLPPSQRWACSRPSRRCSSPSCSGFRATRCRARSCSCCSPPRLVGQLVAVAVLGPARAAGRLRIHDRRNGGYRRRAGGGLAGPAAARGGGRRLRQPG